MEKTWKFLVIFSLALSSCKKYEEGGNTCGIYNKILGVYQIESSIVNGIDSTAHARFLCNNRVEIKRDLNKHSYLIFEHDLVVMAMKDRFNFGVSIDFCPNFPDSTIFNCCAKWTIIKFKGKDFWIKGIDQNIILKFKVLE